MKKSLYTVLVFTRLNTRRFFRDRLALFFGILFPLIFLFVFGGIAGNGNNVSFKVAVINQSDTKVAKEFVTSTSKNKIFKVDKEARTLARATEKMNKSQIDGTIILPPGFGELVSQGGKQYPTGRAEVVYTRNNDQAGQAVISVLDQQFKQANAKYVQAPTPFTVVAKPSSNKSLTPFDYTFAGLLGFSIVGMGIFGPINVFPELKKQGILRRLHTTPLKVWQYFLSTMIAQAIIGLVSLSIMFIVAIAVFHLKVTGNYFEIATFIVLSIITILGIGLAIGGWAKNERQAAPLSNIIVFPMLFLSGTFFPRFAMPEWLQHVSTFLPLTPVIDGLRFLTTEGKHLTDLGPQLGLMALWMVVIYFVAFKVFRWE
jgi:ABC-2 type transport system permease protein